MSLSLSWPSLKFISIAVNKINNSDSNLLSLYKDSGIQGRNLAQSLIT